MSATCESCQFWRRLEGQQGLCRFNPPQGILQMAQKRNLAGQVEAVPIPISFWPPVAAGEWCGRHEIILADVGTEN